MLSWRSSSAFLLALCCVPALAQTPPRPKFAAHAPQPPDAHTLDFPNFESVPYVIESGPLDNDSDEYAVVFSHEVHLPGAAWLRLFYDQAVLAGDSRVRVTSLLDGDVQELNAAILAQWSNTSAYFNGDRVLLELVAGPGTQGNELKLGHVQKQRFDRPGGDDTQAASICGTDDHVPSNEDWAGRIYEEGCSGAIFTTSSAMIGAGHCANNNQVMQFRVPPSLPSCDIVHPPADEQFPILPGWLFECCTVGEDWWVARVGQNGLGQRPFDRYGQLRHVVLADAPTGALAEVVGYGFDSTPCTANYTQQYSPGSILNVAQAYYGEAISKPGHLLTL